MKLWYQSSTEIDRLPQYRDVLAARLAELNADGSSTVNGMPEGTFSRFGLNPVEMQKYPVGFAALMAPMVRRARDAENSGYDVFLMGGFIPLHLQEVRSAVGIPALSLGESSLLNTRPLGKRIGVVVITPHQAELAYALVETLGLRRRTVHINAVQPALNDTQVSESFDDGSALIDSFRNASREAIARGADVVVPGESMMNEVLRVNGIREVDGAPVVDTIHLATAHARMMHDLWRGGAVAAGRLHSYPRLDPHVTDLLCEAPSAGRDLV